MKGNKVNTDQTLFRRSYSNPEHKYYNPDGSATSRVFALRDRDQGMLSVDVKSMTTPQQSIADSSKFMLFEIDEVDVEKAGLFAVHDPISGNVAHAYIEMDEDDDISPGLLARSSRRFFL